MATNTTAQKENEMGHPMDVEIDSALRAQAGKTDKSEGLKRQVVVESINGAVANIRTAKERDRKADALLIEIQGTLNHIREEHTTIDTELRGAYRIHHEELFKAEDPDERVKLIHTINSVLDDIERNRRILHDRLEKEAAALNRAKSEKGTASAELRKLEEHLEELHARLKKLLPDPEELKPLDGAAQ